MVRVGFRQYAPRLLYYHWGNYTIPLPQKFYNQIWDPMKTERINKRESSKENYKKTPWCQVTNVLAGCLELLLGWTVACNHDPAAMDVPVSMDLEHP